MDVQSLADGKLLEPISPDKPAGEDLSVAADWVRIRNTRPNVYDAGSKGNWERAVSSSASWELLETATAEALASQSKDLRLAIWFLEASAKLHGFAGVRDGLRVVRELLVRYWDSGLFPLIDGEDVETRSGPLEWLNDPLAEIVREIPLTLRPDPGVNYSVQYYHESRRKEGLIGAQEFDAAAEAGSRRQYEELKIRFEEAWNELQEFEQASDRLFGAGAPALQETKDAFEACRTVLDGILRKKRAAEPDEVPESGDAAAKLEDQGVDALVQLAGGDAGNAALGASWAEAERMVRAGKIDAGLARMASLSGMEPNGRVRFQRKLLLADVCLNTRRFKLAKSILEELAELIDKHQLEHWENSETIGAAWTRLYRCYKNEEAGTADGEKAARLFERLCRLDPWQALACSDGK